MYVTRNYGIWDHCNYSHLPGKVYSFFHHNPKVWTYYCHFVHESAHFLPIVRIWQNPPSSSLEDLNPSIHRHRVFIRHEQASLEMHPSLTIKNNKTADWWWIQQYSEFNQIWTDSGGSIETSRDSANCNNRQTTTVREPCRTLKGFHKRHKWGECVFIIKHIVHVHAWCMIFLNKVKFTIESLTVCFLFGWNCLCLLVCFLFYFDSLDFFLYCTFCSCFPPFFVFFLPLDFPTCVNLSVLPLIAVTCVHLLSSINSPWFFFAVCVAGQLFFHRGAGLLGFFALHLRSYIYFSFVCYF